jgi:hypothetical protein
MAVIGSSYVVLRALPGDAWWSAVRGRTDVPHAVAALLHGRRRIELGADEAEAALTWARALDGWAAADPKPLVVYAPS